MPCPERVNRCKVACVPATAAHPDLRALGDAFRAARSSAGLSQENFAAEAGMDRGYVGRIERGQHNVSYLNMLKLARAAKAPLAAIVATATAPDAS